MMVEMRSPARMSGSARGSSTESRRRRGLMPIPWAASTTCGDRVRRPVTVFSKIGRRPYATRAMKVGWKPKPTSGTATASMATGGKVWPRLASVRASGMYSSPARRVTKMARATATAKATTPAARTVSTCETVSSRNVPRS